MWKRPFDPNQGRYSFGWYACMSDQHLDAIAGAAARMGGYSLLLPIVKVFGCRPHHGGATHVACACVGRRVISISANWCARPRTGSMLLAVWGGAIIARSNASAC